MNIVTAILSYHHVPSGKKEDLVAAIKPKVIICLGKITFEMVSHKVTKAFLEKLKKGEPWVEKYPSDSDIYIYGVAHCGSRGIANLGSLEIMKKTWKGIKV